MPRVQILKKEYKASDLTKYIRNAMYERHISQADIGRVLNTTQQNVSKKLRNNDYNYKELLALFEYLHTDDDEILKIMKM